MRAWSIAQGERARAYNFIGGDLKVGRPPLGGSEVILYLSCRAMFKMKVKLRSSANVKLRVAADDLGK